MVPLDFQLLTADGDLSPANEAAAAVPPTASTMSSTVPNMSPYNSRIVKVSSPHDTKMDNQRDVMSANAMADSRDQIIARLRLLPDLFGMKIGEFAETIGVNGSTWSNWVSNTNKNEIPRESAQELKEVYGITTDWLYCGDLESIKDSGLRIKIRKAERAALPRRRA